MSRYTALVFFALFAFTAYGQTHKESLPKECIDSSVKKISRPFSKTNSNRSFEYRYRYAEKSSSETTIVVLPGGPGQSAIKGSFDIKTNLVPEKTAKNYSVLYIDPRGLGCNQGIYPKEFYSNENVASDVVALLDELQIDNYVLFGTSYGTLVSTFIASDTSIPPARAVILDGVLGRAFRNGEGVEKEVPRLWDAVVERLSPDQQSKLRNHQLPFSLTEEQWGEWISGMLASGTTTGSCLPFRQECGKGPLDEFMPLILADTVDPNLYWMLHNYFGLGQPDSPDPDYVITFYKNIVCKEMTRTPDTKKSLRNGRIIVKSNESFCQNQPPNRPYDARNFDVRSPIYYFSGDEDPATPLWQATHHFNSQAHTKRNMVTIKGGGHGVLQVALTKCSDDLFEAVINETSIEKVLRTCKVPYEIQKY